MMKITKREKQILCLLCLSNPEIAKVLRIKKSTVRTHIGNLLNKFVENNRQSLLIAALKKNVIDISEIKTEVNYESYREL